MNYTIESNKDLAQQDIEAAAELTALAFGRPADDHNFQDTKEHLFGAERLFARDADNSNLIGFATYRSLLWRCSN